MQFEFILQVSIIFMQVSIIFMQVQQSLENYFSRNFISLSHQMINKSAVCVREKKRSKEFGNISKLEVFLIELKKKIHLPISFKNQKSNKIKKNLNLNPLS